jgi:hypothetical protein
MNINYNYKHTKKLWNGNIFMKTCFEILIFLLLSFSGIVTVVFCSIIIYAGNYLKNLELWSVVLAALFLFLMVVILLVIGRQPNSSVKLSFKVRHFSDFRVSK